MVDITIQTTKTNKEVRAVFADNHINVDHKTKENNKIIIMQTSKQSYKCGTQHNQNHLQSCPAKDKICSQCAKRGHFAKICRSTNVNCLGNRQDEQQEEIETESLETENDPMAFAELTSNNGWDEYQIDKFSVMATAESNTDRLNSIAEKIKLSYRRMTLTVILLN